MVAVAEVLPMRVAPVPEALPGEAEERLIYVCLALLFLTVWP